MSKINIARWILLEICFWIFYAQFGYPIFEGIFTLNTSSNGSIGFMVGKIIPTPFQLCIDTPSNSLGMKRYEFFCQTTQPESSGRP
jgi:hypothetical protein